MVWLVPFSSLTPGQQDAAQLDTRGHKAIIGGPGAGKSLVLLHRLSLLFNKAKQNPDALRLFVYTTTLKGFIRSGIDVLGVPEECISTIDKWCKDTHEKYIGPLPRRTAGRFRPPDFDKARAAVGAAIDRGVIPAPIFDYVLVDETQDMDVPTIGLLKKIARHVTVCMDGKQQLYDGRATEAEILEALGLTRQNVALLAAFRCNPFVTRLAAQFIPDEARRKEFLNQAANMKMDRSKPLLYVAANFDDELARMVELVKLRLIYGDVIAILFPKQDQVHGFARGLAELGIEADLGKRGSPIDFSNRLPKLMTYHGAKGLTFDSVFLPRLVQLSFPGILQTRLGHLLFVGVSRATSWVYLSGINGSLIQPLIELGRGDTGGFLELQRSPAIAGLLLESPQRESGAPSSADEFGLD